MLLGRRRKTREENEGALRSRLSSLRLTEELRLGSIVQARRPTAGWLAGLAWRTQRAHRATHRDHSPEPSSIQSQRFSFSTATSLFFQRKLAYHREIRPTSELITVHVFYLTRFLIRGVRFRVDVQFASRLSSLDETNSSI